MSQIVKEFQTNSNKIKLICFPFAGGYSESFRQLNTYLKDHLHLLAINPPGHGPNQMELVENIEELVSLYIKEILPVIDGKFALFGYSMGSLIVYRVAQELQKIGISPEAIILSATKPPNRKYIKVSKLDDTELLAYLVNLGGVPSELLNSKELLQYFLPIFRSDFKALESYIHKDKTVLQSPVHIFEGRFDQFYFNQSSDWYKFANKVNFYTFDGNHMFLNSEVKKVAETIRTIILG